ncbi:hypothetical protein PTTG_29037 [Puccinia triticina 1-1 BBBD Race 1]|uniref:Uncharacterized protein n=1 Tax=Puccinia triticina (isolate 1-1 / race 1 (BBBD)) TaxID=630390 RepID=A0A180G6Z3_PUCT1|nr:hypothetical protein PTTG_29037 [Puccinia triticina 1-1 BBBD Race 1]
MPRIQGHATAQLFQSIYPHDPKIAAGNPAPSPSRQPTLAPPQVPPPYTTGKRRRRSADNNNLRRACILNLGTLFLCLQHLHRFIFINSSAFPPRTGPVIVHPGLDPDLSVPPHNLSDHILGPARRLDSHGPTLKRFQPVWITQSPLSCRLSPKTKALIWMRFLDGAGRTKGALKVMIALNLHSSQQVLPVITNPILTSLRYLGAENVGLGVQHHMRCAKEETIWMGVDRIKLLSEYRNQALLAFDNADWALDGLSNLVFIDDVFLCAQDILELLWQHHFQGADSACGTDWWEAKTLREQYGSQTPRHRRRPLAFGGLLQLILTEYKDGYAAICGAKELKVFQARFHNVLPVPVYLCWNDIVALAPAPFRGPEGLTFRAANRLTNECPSSECQLFA